MFEYHDFDSLLGLTFSSVTTDTDEQSITFICRDTGKKYVLKHVQDCCEGVFIESIVGDLADLVNTPITFAEESSRDGDTEEGIEAWTFYKLGTVKGWVDVRFYGSSNGYYGVGVSLFTPEEEIL